MSRAELLAPALAQLQAYQAPTLRGGIKLDAMENTHPLPDDLRQAWLAVLADVEFNRYPDAQALLLKEALVARFPMPDDWQILLGNGSDEIIQLLCLAVARPGAVVMAPDPSFVMYRQLALACGLRFVGVPLRADFSLDGAAFLAAMEREQPALVFLAQPNNPTGNAFDPAVVADICAAAPGLVVIDEAYIPFADGDASALARRHDHVLLMRTLSKWGLAGLRLGFLQGARPWLAEFEKLRLPYNVNVLTQASACFALENEAHFQAQIDAIVAERARLETALAELPGTEVFPSQANFLLVRQAPDAAVAIHQQLAAAGVLIKRLDGGHPALAGCLRPSIGTPAENDVLLQYWREAVAK